MALKSSAEVREEFDRAGDSVCQWALENGYAPSLVYRVLSSDVLPKRGKSHDIAVKLGMKLGKVNPERERQLFMRIKHKEGTMEQT